MSPGPVEAVFLDRDGTIIEEVGYLARAEQVRLLSDADRAIRMWNDSGVRVIVVTNQAGVARGYFPESRVAEIHERLVELLAEAGARVDAFYYCPHHPVEGREPYRMDCACRKPKPGMLRSAARDWNLDLSRSWMIGDKACDARAGAAAGCRTILVRTGHGARLEDTTAPGDWRLAGIVADLSAAATLWRRLRDEQATRAA